MGETAVASMRLRVARLIVFGLILAVSIALAAGFWPNDERITPTTDIEQVDISANGHGADVKGVWFEPAKDGGTNITVDADFTARTGSLKVKTYLAPTSVPTGCINDPGACTPISDRIVNVAGKRLMEGPSALQKSLDIENHESTSPYSVYSVEFTVPAIDGAGYPAQASSGYAGVILPDIRARLNNAVARSGPFSWPDFKTVTFFSVCLATRLSGFNWTYGQIPDSVEVNGPNCLQAIWNLRSSDAAAKVIAGTASADLPAQLNIDDQDTLVAGVFIGLAGAAAIAFVTDAIRPWRRQLAPAPELTISPRFELFVAIPQKTQKARSSKRIRSFRAERLRSRRRN
jgi:hypothetical protein